MNTSTLIAIVIAVVALAVILWLVARERNRNRLRSRFGPEYDRLVHESGSRANAEGELARREKRVKKFTIRELTAQERGSFIQEWLDQQKKFIDEPKTAVSEADALVTEVMRTRGYPMSDFDTQAADLSVDHPHVVDNYREAHRTALRSGSGDATTEDLRKAMVCYRALFEDLVGRKVVTTQYEEVRR